MNMKIRGGPQHWTTGTRQPVPEDGAVFIVLNVNVKDVQQM